MLFANDFVLIDEIREGIDAKLESWRERLEVKSFRLSRVETKYMEFKVSSIRSSELRIIIGDVELP